MSFELNKGFAIIIDDQFGKGSGDAIDTIANNLRDLGMPFCVYNSLDDAKKAIHNFGGISFLILDWRLFHHMGEELPNVSMGDSIKKENAKRNIEFLSELKNHCFAPVFIFSSEDKEDIEDELGEIINEKSELNYILIKSKSELSTKEEIQDAIKDWIEKNPAIYTLKTWQDSHSKAKVATFWHLFAQSPLWPKVLWDTSDQDGINPSRDLIDKIERNIYSRISVPKYDSTIISNYDGEISTEAIKKVLGGIMYISNDNLDENDLQPGDIFKIDGDYYLNIRPICDTVISRDGCDGDFYAIKGSKINPSNLNRRASQHGISEQIDEVIIYALEEKDFFRFSFKRLYIKIYNNEKAKRKCRLLPPYINHVQQRYSSYVGRLGLPKMPSQIITEYVQGAQ